MPIADAATHATVRTMTVMRWASTQWVRRSRERANAVGWLAFTAHLAQQLGGPRNGEPDFVSGMKRRDEEPQPRRFLGNRRIQHRLHVDPSLEEPIGELEAMHRVADDHRNDWRVGARSGIE